MKSILKRCRKRRQEHRPGEILDQVISQSSSTANKCLLYKLANYKRGGDLIDAIQTGGQMAVEQLIRDQFGVFMYNNGKGQVINRAEFLRWKYMEHKEVVIPIEASLSPHDPLGKWVDHRACWQMQYRGALGESLLHVLIICDTKVHTKLARLLLRVFPILAIDVMEGEEYLGASALHLAIAYSNNELVQDLIDSGADVQQRAIGSFFLPRDQQMAKQAKNTDYEGLAYLGEYPLAWAACCANESVYNLLIDNDADPDAQDSFGNMILHMVVVCDKLDMFGYALRHPRQPARNGIVNLSGLTPLTLACKLGRAEVFREMLELSSREFWRYSNITCSGYPLNALDTLLPDGRTNWNSALFIILNGTKEEHLDMLDGGIIQRLLEEKWKTFARNQFLKRLLILLIHLLCLSMSVYLRPTTKNMAVIESKLEEADRLSSVPDTQEDEEESEVRTIMRYCSEVATILGVLSYVIFQQGDELKNQGLGAFMKQLSNAPAKAIFLVSNLMILACIPFRIMGDTDTEEAILVFAVPGSWFLLMFFAGAIRLTGPFVTMIYSMITGDMFTFGIIYLIVLFGFSQAFYFLYKGHPQVETTLFHSYPSTWMALFQTTLGDYNYADLNNTSYPNLGKTVFVIFMIFVPILLLNMLIAMMGNTYAHVIEQSEKEWMKQWAKIVVTLERAVPQTDAQKYIEAYSIPLGITDDSGFEQRGVMVIKSKSKTRAKQRKGAVSNWKRVGRVTIDALKKRHMTGEEMRRLMWGRTSISSPTKIPKKKLKDPYALPSDSALTAALDVMSYTHDIVMIDDMPPITSTSSANDKLDIHKKINLDPKNAVQSTLAHIHDGFETHKDYKDPLRELVLISEAFIQTDDTALVNLDNLAKEATILTNVKEIHPEQKIITNPPASSVSQMAPPKPPQADLTLGQMFQDPMDIIDPEKEREFYEKLQALDESESTDFGEKPALGKVSFIRRAKSAVSRTTSAQKKIFDHHPLFQMAWMDPSDADVQQIAKSTLNQRPDTAARDGNVKDKIDNVEDDDDHNGDDDEIVTVQDVKRCMEDFHLRRRLPMPAENVTKKTKKNDKYSKRSSKNKVSPSEKDGIGNNTGRPWKSANGSSKKKPESPPDPLEPWSTRELMNINKILES